MTRIKTIAAAASVQIGSHCHVPLTLTLELDSGNQHSVLLMPVPRKVGYRYISLKKILFTGVAEAAADYEDFATPRKGEWLRRFLWIFFA